MKNTFAFCLLAVLGLASGSCAASSPQPPDSVRKEPPLELEKYLAGHTRSWGIIEDRFGKSRDQFTVDLHGWRQGQAFHLDQQFTYASGKTQRRIWEIHRLSATEYVATATDIQGQAHAWIHGGAVHLKYTLAVPFGKHGRKVNVQFNQWLWRQTDGIVFNRVDVRKFGIRLARVSEFFQKSPPRAP